VTIADIKAYRPTSHSLGSGQVLHCPYTNQKARLITREMADQLVLDLVDKRLVTDQLVLTVGYDIENLTDPERRKAYKGAVVTDHYGRQIPKHAHGTVNLPLYCSSTNLIVEAVVGLYDQIADPNLLVRRLNLVACHILPEEQTVKNVDYTQLDLFSDPEEDRRREAREAALKRERRRQHAVLTIKKKYGKNAIVKGMNLEEGATAMDRNGQIGGHKA
jgi:DNA polymerase V